MFKGLSYGVLACINLITATRFSSNDPFIMLSVLSLVFLATMFIFEVVNGE